ncbi:MAG: glycosyltransferase family 1 protein [Chitinophagales bacterium]
MLIAVNTRFLIKDKLEGIGWYTFETMQRLTRQHPEHTFLFLFDRDYDESFVFSENVIPLKVWPPARHPYLWQFWFDYSLPKIFRRYKPDLFISPDGFLSLKSHVPTLLVIHDLGFEHYPEHTPGIVSKYYRKFTPLFAHRAKRILTVSQFSKKDIVQHYRVDPDKVDVSPNGANPLYKPLHEKEKMAVRQQYAHGTPYFIYVGSVHPRKNINSLLLAYDALRKDDRIQHKLVIAGRMAWKTEETKRIYEQMQSKEDVVFTGHVQLEELTRIVGAADALVYPSLFEGFGIPVVEARYAGIPIISSDRSSLKEVGGEHAIYFDPEQIDGITNAMRYFLENKAAYMQKAADVADVRAHFHWDKTAECMEMAIQKMDKRFQHSNRKVEVA